MLLQPTTKVTKKSNPPKVLSDSQLVTHIPYPSRAIKSRENFKYAKFCDILGKLEVTLPFTEVILNMPTYTKFLKDILANKRALGDQEIVAMEEACSAHLLNKMPTKLGDPGSFSIPCVVGGVPISRALCDLGESVSVLEDIPVKVGKIEGDKVEFNLPNLMKGPKEEIQCTIEVIDEVVESVAREESEMEEALQISLHDEEMKEDHVVDDELMKKVERLLPPKVQLKPLPPSLKYGFLGEGESYPVIIKANFSEAQEQNLLKVLNAHKSSLGYNIDDIKGLIPNLCMHQIILEEGSQPKVEGLRRINPKMAEVVKMRF
ncbi:uncharacterized protein LOC141651256 [Silene latifolia]|uniref:uncharacterized protein LOC141651256 n=1 Tax=Silene latifolia TaxID=37657 RepID=UPI003D786951